MHNLASVSSNAISKARLFIKVLHLHASLATFHTASTVLFPYWFKVVFDDTAYGTCSFETFIHGLKRQHSSHNFAERTTSDQHKEPFTGGCEAKEKKSRRL